MPFYFKPVVWNDQGYLRPSGGRFASGYPAEHGFGHEEWNNSPALSYRDGQLAFRVFHTEGLGARPLDEEAGQIVLMMIASHNRRQYLVAMAAGCISLFGDHHRGDRLKLVKELGLHKDHRADDAWALPSVRAAYKNNRDRFARQWEDEIHYTPTWLCPEALYLPLREPLQLNPQMLTGKPRLIGMYGAYQATNANVALRLLDEVPPTEDQATVARLKAFCGDDSISALGDIVDLQDRKSNDPTTKAALIQARLGQGRFRADVLAAWTNGCAVTGCQVAELLRASHIVPWADCDDAERLDPENGLPLAAHLDALFDRGLVTFSDTGELIRSSELDGRLPEQLQLGDRLVKAPSQRMVAYLKRHRDSRFRP